MRFLKLFIGLILILGLLAVIGYYGQRDILAWWGARDLLQDFKRIQRLAKQPLEDHGYGCQKENSLGSEGRESIYSNLAGYQVRFLTDKDYVVELVCGTVVPTYVKLSESEIQGGMTKVSGSGFFYPAQSRFKENQSFSGGVKLGRGSREIFVGFDESKPKLDWGETEISYFNSNAPQTTCEGWSGVCCTNPNDIGVGFSVKSSDCPEKCFQQCLQVPQVTQFYMLNFDTNEPQIMAIEGRPVKFIYEATDVDGVINNVSLDFGDGSIVVAPIDPGASDPDQQPKKIAEFTSDHTYQCDLDFCEYTAAVSVTDNDGLSNVDDGGSRIQVLVQGQQL